MFQHLLGKSKRYDISWLDNKQYLHVYGMVQNMFLADFMTLVDNLITFLVFETKLSQIWSRGFDLWFKAVTSSTVWTNISGLCIHPVAGTVRFFTSPIVVMSFLVIVLVYIFINKISQKVMWGCYIDCARHGLCEGEHVVYAFTSWHQNCLNKWPCSDMKKVGFEYWSLLLKTFDNCVNCFYLQQFTSYYNLPKFSCSGNGGSLCLGLLWWKTLSIQRKSTCPTYDRIPSSILSLGIEPWQYWWVIWILTFDPAGHLSQNWAVTWNLPPSAFVTGNLIHIPFWGILTLALS